MYLAFIAKQKKTYASTWALSELSRFKQCLLLINVQVWANTKSISQLLSGPIWSLNCWGHTLIQIPSTYLPGLFPLFKCVNVSAGPIPLLICCFTNLFLPGRYEVASGRGKFFSFWLFLSAQRAKMWAYRHIFSHFSLISQVRKVRLRQLKSLWAIRCTPVHYGQSGVHQCTMGNQVYTSAPWASRCTPVHYGQSSVHQCTMGNQGYTSALQAIRGTPVHYG